ncbi:MAG: hypothetical protein IPO52_06435 [Gemmatimonadetes bacterium]|nr:hypothetical protein [Gemmatimonadota bacterium]MBP9896921.1 hypothetical protein [Gemmatimonadales bacterium]
MIPISEEFYYLLLALPVGSFILGALWMRGHIYAQRLRAKAEATPLPLQSPGLETQLLDALDSVQVQLAELAERQDFTERILTRQPKRSRMDTPTPVPTPV